MIQFSVGKYQTESAQSIRRMFLIQYRVWIIIISLFGLSLFHCVQYTDSHIPSYSEWNVPNVKEYKVQYITRVLLYFILKVFSHLKLDCGF